MVAGPYWLVNAAASPVRMRMPSATRVLVSGREPSVLTHWAASGDAVPFDQMEASVAVGVPVLSVKVLSCMAGVAPVAVSVAPPRTA